MLLGTYSQQTFYVFFAFFLSSTQARDAHISELEAQEKALTEARERLNRSRDALTDDAFRAQDLLCAAAHRMRRLRAERSAADSRRSAGGGAVCAMMSPLLDDTATTGRVGNPDGVGYADTRARASATATAARGRRDEDVLYRGDSNSNSSNNHSSSVSGEGAPAFSSSSRPPSLPAGYSVDDTRAAAAAEWDVGPALRGRRRHRPYRGGGGGEGGGRRASHLSASVPVWGGGDDGGGGGGRGDRGGGRGNHSAARNGLLPTRRRGLLQDDDEEEEEEEVGVGREGTESAAAAMDVLREVERMQVSGNPFFFSFFYVQLCMYVCRKRFFFVVFWGEGVFVIGVGERVTGLGSSRFA